MNIKFKTQLYIVIISTIIAIFSAANNFQAGAIFFELPLSLFLFYHFYHMQLKKQLYFAATSLVLGLCCLAVMKYNKIPISVSEDVFKLISLPWFLFCGCYFFKLWKKILIKLESMKFQYQIIISLSIMVIFLIPSEIIRNVAGILFAFPLGGYIVLVLLPRLHLIIFNFVTRSSFEKLENNIQHKDDILTRTKSIAVIAAIVALCYSSTILFVISVFCIIGIMLYEWQRVSSQQSKLFQILGTIYIYIPLILMLFPIINKQELLWLFCTVCVCDIFAFLGGKLFKGSKLAPTISPGKTWSGAIVGSICAFVFAHIFWTPHIHLPNIFIELLQICIIIAAIFGDLLQSKTKRIIGIKDMGNIIPGHGGLCDRFDGFIAALLVMYIFKLFTL